jgi:SAM-dependent methyltransferase
MRLNLGAGELELEGYEARDGANGDVLFPLPDADGSVDEIRASHVLEHFSHRQAADVLKDWVAKLAPGGRLRIAVPDFEKIARDYLDGNDIDIQGYTFGGHLDERDWHGCAFDRELLTEIFLNLGLTRLHDWTSELDDAAALPISLNLGGYKPSGPATRCENTTAVLSAPRFGPVAHFRCALSAFGRSGVRYQVAGGAYWHQVMSEVMESQLEDASVRYVITCDYDTVFFYEDVMELYRLMEACPDVDAIIPVQSKRAANTALFGITGDDGKPKTSMPTSQLNRNLLPVSTGHFGLTIFRADMLRSFERPWMSSKPNSEGRWVKGKVDPDIDFWFHWKESGRTLYLAPRVVVGHQIEMVAWPGKDLKTIYQTLNEFEEGGMPEGARR